MRLLKPTLFVFTLLLSITLSAEVRPYYGASLTGMNRNVLQRQKSALERGDKEVVGNFKVVAKHCHDRNLQPRPEAVKSLGVAYFFSEDEQYAQRAVGLLEQGIDTALLDDNAALIDFIDGLILLGDSKPFAEQGKPLAEKVLDQLPAGNPLNAAVVAFYRGDTARAGELLANVSGEVCPELAAMAEKVGVDLRSIVVATPTEGRLALALDHLTHPEFTGTVLSDEDFLLKVLNLDYKGLEQVKAAVEKGRYAQAKSEYVRYLKTRDNFTWYFDWRERTTGKSLNPDFDCTEADMVVDNNLLSVGIRHRFEGEIDWMANPTPNKYKEWTWHLSYHDFWIPLMDAYWATGKEIYAQTFVRQMRSWVEQSPRPDFHGRVLYSRWRSIEAGMRSWNFWANAFLGFLSSPSFDDESIFIMAKSFYEHALHLRAYYRSHNWLAKEMCGLFTIATIFPEMKEAPEWQKFASDTMYAQLDIQLYPSGFQNELSPGYHVGTQRNMATLLRLGKLNGYKFHEGHDTGIEKTYDCFLRSIMPDGLMPANNDSWWSDGKQILSEGLEAFPDREDFRYIVTSGAEGRKPCFTSVWMPWEGWAIMRSGWESDALYSYFDVGPYGAGHQHEDKLSFLIHAYGKRLVTEGATYAYDGSKWRHYIVSSRAHNLSRVDGMEQFRYGIVRRPGIKVNAQPQQNRWVERENLVFSEGVYDEGFGLENDTTVTQYRAMAMIRNRYWLVFDIFTPRDSAAHNYETWFHLNSTNCKILEGMNGVVTTDEDCANIALVTLRKDAGLNVVCGQEIPEVQGWVSAAGTSGHRCNPVATPTFTVKAAGEQLVPYLIYPLRKGESLPVERITVENNNQIVIHYTDGKQDIINFNFNGSKIEILDVMF